MLPSLPKTPPPPPPPKPIYSTTLPVLTRKEKNDEIFGIFIEPSPRANVPNIISQNPPTEPKPTGDENGIWPTIPEPAFTNPTISNKTSDQIENRHKFKVMPSTAKAKYKSKCTW